MRSDAKYGFAVHTSKASALDSEGSLQDNETDCHGERQWIFFEEAACCPGALEKCQVNSNLPCILLYHAT